MSHEIIMVNEQALTNIPALHIGRDPARQTIGVLSMNLADSRVLSVYEGIAEVAEQAQLNVVCYAVGMVEARRMDAAQMSRALSQLISPTALDGLLTMQFWHSREWFETFCQQFISMPIVTISRCYEGYSGVASGTYAGGRSLVCHMIESHGFNRFAFICAHKENTTHQQRYQSFLDECAAHQIDVPAAHIIEFDEWVFTAHPNEDSLNRGRIAIERLLDERGLQPGKDFQALLSASEMVAIGAIKELQRRGFSVPHDVAVVSDENTAEGAVITPPLTTLGVAWKEMGRVAARILIRQLREKTRIEHAVVDALLVVRHSCGCYSSEVELAGLDATQSGELDLSSQIEARSAVIQALQHEARQRFVADGQWAEDIFDAYLADIVQEAPLSARESRFLRLLESVLIRWGEAQGQLISAHTVFLHLHRYAFARFAQDSERLRRSESLLLQGQIIISQLSEQIQVNFRVEQARLITIIQEIGQRLISSFDMKHLVSILSEELPQLKIRRCYLSLYVDPDFVSGDSTLLLAFDEHGLKELPAEGVRFPSPQLVPPAFLPADGIWNMVVEPLYFGHDHIGFVLFETSAPDSKVYDLLRSEISSALKGALLMQRLKQRTQETEDSNQALQDSIAALRLYQGRLIQAEKMAALGQLVAGVAHEINTPLGIGVTAASCLDQETKALQSILQEGHLHKSDLVRYLEIALESSRLILSSLSRADVLVQSFKRVAVDQQFEEERDFHLKPYLEDILSNLLPSLRQTQHSVEIDCPDDIYLHGQPGVFYQILSNLIINSLTHAFEGIEHGHMRLEVSVLPDGQLRFYYCDDGVGMDEVVQTRVFDPFFTTKRGQGGTGLGMNIVFNLVTQQLKGNIECSSTPGHGACFDVIIPYTAARSSMFLTSK